MRHRKIRRRDPLDVNRKMRRLGDHEKVVDGRAIIVGVIERAERQRERNLKAVVEISF
jgi:hypothetical protein